MCLRVDCSESVCYSFIVLLKLSIFKTVDLKSLPTKSNVYASLGIVSDDFFHEWATLVSFHSLLKKEENT